MTGRRVIPHSKLQIRLTSPDGCFLGPEAVGELLLQLGRDLPEGSWIVRRAVLAYRAPVSGLSSDGGVRVLLGDVGVPLDRVVPALGGERDPGDAHLEERTELFAGDVAFNTEF